MSGGKLAPPKLQDLRKLCIHYEKKAGGQYASDSRAARYLFELSREIQSVLDLIELEDARKTRRIEHLERVAAEWSNLLAARSTAQEDEARERAEALQRQLNAAQEKIGILEQALAQQQRDLSVTAERAQQRLQEEHAAAMEQATAAHTRQMDELRANYSKTCNELMALHDIEMRAAAKRYEEKLAEAAKERLTLVREHTAYIDHVREQHRTESQLRELEWQRRYETLELAQRKAVQELRLAHEYEMAKLRSSMNESATGDRSGGERAGAGGERGS